MRADITASTKRLKGREQVTRKIPLVQREDTPSPSEAAEPPYAPRKNSLQRALCAFGASTPAVSGTVVE